MTKNPTFISSEYASTRVLISDLVSIKDIDEFLVGVAKRLSKCLSKSPELSGWEIEYKNILERDANPDGCNTFFVIRKTDVESQRNPVFTHLPQ